MKASEIITKARYILSDIDMERWNNDRLLSLLNDGILDLAVTTRIYSSEGYISLVKDLATYNISKFSLMLERIEYKNKTIEKKTHKEMDYEYGEGWQIITDKLPKIAVYDLQSSGNFTVYPIPTVGVNKLENINDNYFGVITSVYYTDSLINTPLKKIGGDSNENYLKVYYIKVPKKVELIDDDLDSVVTLSMVPLLADYVSAMALKDNMDTQNLKIASMQKTSFETNKSELVKREALNNMQRNRYSSYNSWE